MNIDKLSKYTWWQLKKHSKLGKPVFTCAIQDPKDKAHYYSATDSEPQAAIDDALKEAVDADA